MKRLIAAMAVAVFGVPACGADVSEPALSHTETVEAWRAQRLASLTAPQGYLNLVGLFWLEPGVYSFGGGEGMALVFPGADAMSMGTFELGPEGITMLVEDGVDVRIDDAPVTSVFMPDDTRDDNVTATYGTLVWTIIRRQDMYGIRLFDTENPVAANLPPIPRYDIDERWRVPAALRLYDEPRIANVGTVIEGLGYNPETPGVLEFEIDGETHTLEAYASSNNRLFLVFGDRTSGRETYPAGRFPYADAPGEDGMTVLDFNMSYNPPCAFNDFSTCPVASPRNRLSIEVTAGEKYIDALHVGVAAH